MLKLLKSIEQIRKEKEENRFAMIPIIKNFGKSIETEPILEDDTINYYKDTKGFIYRATWFV